VGTVSTARIPRKRKATYHHGDLRTALLAASRRLVREHGPALFSLREAARLVGVDPAACYRHFRDRDEVLLALAQEGFADLAGVFAKLRRGSDPSELLLAMSHAYFAFAVARPAEFRLMFGESGVPSTDPRMRLSRVEKGPYQQLHEASAAYLAAAGSAADATELANMLWSVVHGLTRLVVDGALVLGEDGVSALLEKLTETILSACPPARRKTR
jgi:AcrR family transcriptional regulator